MTTRERAPWPDDTYMRTWPWVTRTSWRYTGCANMNLTTSKLSKAIVWQYDRHTDRQTSHPWSLLVTWQRWRSPTIGSAIGPVNPTLHANLMALSFLGPELWATEVYMLGIGIFDSLYTNFTLTLGRYTGCANMNFVRQCCWNLSFDRQKVTRGHFRLRSRNRKPHAACKPDGSIFYRTGVIGDRSLHCRNKHFWRFWLLWPVTRWTMNLYELDPYSLEIYGICKYELRTSKLSKVTVWHAYRQTYIQRDRQTDRIDRNYKPLRFAGGK